MPQSLFVNLIASFENRYLGRSGARIDYQYPVCHADKDYLADKAARAIEFNLVSMESARLASTHGAFAPATIAPILTPLQSFELTL